MGCLTALYVVCFLRWLYLPLHLSAFVSQEARVLVVYTSLQTRCFLHRHNEAALYYGTALRLAQ